MNVFGSRSVGPVGRMFVRVPSVPFRVHVLFYSGSLTTDVEPLNRERLQEAIAPPPVGGQSPLTVLPILLGS